MEKKQLLKDFLILNNFIESQRTEKGKTLSEVGVLEEDMNNEIILLLAKLGWDTWFDAESSFFLDNKHSEIIQYFLSGISIDANVSDFWVDNEILKLNIVYKKKEYCYKTSVDYQSDYFEIEFVFDSIFNFLKNIKKKYKMLSFDTNDQMLCILLVPDIVAEFIKNNSILPLRKI